MFSLSQPTATRDQVNDQILEYAQKPGVQVGLNELIPDWCIKIYIW